MLYEVSEKWCDTVYVITFSIICGVSLFVMLGRYS